MMEEELTAEARRSQRDAEKMEGRVGEWEGESASNEVCRRRGWVILRVVEGKKSKNLHSVSLIRDHPCHPWSKSPFSR
jgi:hypothetical protein